MIGRRWTCSKIVLVCINVLLFVFFQLTTPPTWDESNSCFDNFPDYSRETELPSYCNRVTRCPKHGVCNDSRLKECRVGVIDSTRTMCVDDSPSTVYNAIFLLAAFVALYIVAAANQTLWRVLRNVLWSVLWSVLWLPVLLFILFKIFFG